MYISDRIPHSAALPSETNFPRSDPWFDAPHRLGPRLLNKLYSLWVSATYPFAAIGKGVSIHHTCDIRNPRLIQLGNDVMVDKDVWLHPVLPMEHKCGPAIIIDDGTFIARRCQISARNQVHIERDVLLSASVLITDNSHAYEDVTRSIKHQGFMRGGKVRIGEGCWIGHGAAIVCTQGELTLGRNCVVAANALITRSFPDYSVVSGNPARVVRQFNPTTKAWALGSSRPNIDTA